MARKGSMGGVVLVLALVFGTCVSSAQADEPVKREAVSVADGYDPRTYTEDSWQLGYCISAENEAAEEHEQDGEYGTGTYADLLADRPCTLDLAFGYGKLLEKHDLIDEKDYAKVWKVLSDKEPKFRDNVIRFSDGYAENFVNQ